MNHGTTTHLIRRGLWLLEIDLQTADDPETNPWGPTMSLADARRLERASHLLAEQNLEEAATLGRLFKLESVHPDDATGADAA